MAGQRWGEPERRPPNTTAVWVVATGLLMVAAYAIGAWGTPSPVRDPLPPTPGGVRVVVQAPTPDPALAALARAELRALTPSPTATPAPSPTDVPLPTAMPVCDRAVGRRCQWPNVVTPTPTAAVPVCRTPVPLAVCDMPAPTGAPLQPLSKGK